MGDVSLNLIADGNEPADMVKQLLEAYLGGEIPGFIPNEVDEYVPYAEKMLLRINQFFGHPDDDGFPEDWPFYDEQTRAHFERLKEAQAKIVTIP